MWSRTMLLFVLVVLTAGPGGAAPVRYAYGYPAYGWRDCWVTMTGLGVCAPAVPARPRRAR
jgi:hypothetical protein